MQVAADYTKADLTERERLIADYAAKITRSADTCSLQDVDNLRTAGFTDEDILGIVGIVTYQNMTTRIMESLSTVD
jgi:uncharacterized peroxidase-related enzyme